MDNGNQPGRTARFFIFILTAIPTIVAIFTLQAFQTSRDGPSTSATYSHGLLHLTIPYHAARAGAGKLTMEVLDPEDNVLGRAERHVDVARGPGRWQDEIKLEKELPLDDLVWHRVRYRFEYEDRKTAGLEGTESISQILRRPVIHVLGQQSYLTGGLAAVRVIVTDSKNEVIAGRNSVQIQFLECNEQPRLLFAGQINHRGTTEAQFPPSRRLGGQLPVAVCGGYSDRFNRVYANGAAGRQSFHPSDD